MIDTSLVVDKHDKEFIEDAICLYEKGFFRASYLMAWLCSVESFRSKFKTMAEKGDDKTIWEKINSTENNHQSADRLIVESVLGANFIDDTEKQTLEYFYKMRCVYGHPYEQSPNAVDCEHIIQSVIDILLSKKLLLGKTNIDSIFKKITEEESFLENETEKLKIYFAGLLERIEPRKYSYLLKILSEYYEQCEKENEDNFSFKRIKFFVEELVEKVGLQKILETPEQQEYFVYKTKKIALLVLSQPDIFEHLDEHIKTIVFNELTSAKDSKKLAFLMNDKLLSESQSNEIQALLDSEKLNLEFFDAKYIIKILISKLESHDFNEQNSAIRTIKSAHVKDTLKNCDEDDLILLGRNILQSANHESYSNYYSASAYQFLCDSQKLQSTYPSEMMMGIVAECFTNEKQKIIRPKIFQIEEVGKIFELYSAKTQKKIWDYVNSLIDSYDSSANCNWDSIRSDSLFYPLVEKIKK